MSFIDSVSVQDELEYDLLSPETKKLIQRLVNIGYIYPEDQATIEQQEEYINNLEDKIDRYTEEMDELEDEVSEKNRIIDELEDKVAQLEDTIAELRDIIESLS